MSAHRYISRCRSIISPNMPPDKPEPFPSLTPTQTDADGSNEAADQDRSDADAPATANPARRTRGASLRDTFLNSNPPLGMWQATGEVGSKIPTLPEIRNGAFSAEGWSHEGQMEKRGTNPHEIHRRRLARTSSASTHTRKSSITAATPATPTISEEAREFFPKRASVSGKEPTIEEGAVPSYNEQQRCVSSLLLATSYIYIL